MKKTLLTLGAVLGVSAGAFAQGGSITLNSNSTSTAAVAVEEWDPTGPANWYSGDLTLQVYYAPDTDPNAASEVAAINSYEGSDSANVSSAEAIADLNLDTDFTLETLANPSSGTLGTGNTSVIVTSATGIIDTTVDLPNVPSDSNAYWIILGTATIGGETYDGLLGFASPYMSTGDNASPSDDGTAWNNAGINMNLAPDIAPAPEPATLALAGLGGLSMLSFRRRKA